MSSSEKIKVSNFGKGVLTYKYKTPLPSAIYEWKESAISDDLIALNLISIPNSVFDTNLNIVSYPFFDITQLPYEFALDKFRISKIPSERTIWTYSGYELINDNLDYKLNDDFEFKVVPMFRSPYGKYESTLEKAIIILPKISIRLAKKIFPEKYSSIVLSEDLEAIDFWQNVFNSNISIVLTEGHKKALSLLSNGIVALSISQNCFGLETAYDNGKLFLTIEDDLKRIFQFRPRTFYVTFDYDPKPYVRNLAYSAMIFIAKQAESYGNKAKIISLPNDILKGVDDYIYANGFNDFKVLYDNAYTIEEFSKKHVYNLDEIFEEYKTTQTSYQWCFESVKKKSIVRFIEENKI